MAHKQAAAVSLTHIRFPKGRAGRKAEQIKKERVTNQLLRVAADPPTKRGRMDGKTYQNSFSKRVDRGLEIRSAQSSPSSTTLIPIFHNFALAFQPEWYPSALTTLASRRRRRRWRAQAGPTLRSLAPTVVTTTVGAASRILPHSLRSRHAALSNLHRTTNYLHPPPSGG